MASLFSARRKPKRIASTEVPEEPSRSQGQEEDADDGPVIRRPTTAPKAKSKLRMSFNPSAADITVDNPSDSQPTKSSRLGAAAVARSIPRREEQDPFERPSYSKSYLDELKGSTPTTPKELSLYNSSAEEQDDIPTAQTQALDIASKFGPQPSKPSLIPSAAEIAEKKERRVRLAKEAQATALSKSKPSGGSVSQQDDFISLDAYDSDGEFKPSRMQLSTYQQDDRLAHEKEYTRLIPEDEDMAEGFDTFVEDNLHHDSTTSSNRIHMGNLQANSTRNRQAIRELINTAEGNKYRSSHTVAADDAGANVDHASDSDDGSDSDASASHAYMAAQTQHGVGFSHLSREERRRHEKAALRPRQPEKTTPIPTLTAGVARLRELQEQAEMGRLRTERRRAEIVARLNEVEGEKERIQSGLEELGKQLEEAERKVAAEVQAEAEAEAEAEGRIQGHGDGDGGGEGQGKGSGSGRILQNGVAVQRGLDSIGAQ